MQTGILSLVTAPAAEPVGLDEIKAHLRVDDTTEDGLIIGKMIAARMMAEAWTGRALCTQTWDWFLPEFPADCYGGTFLVPYPPLVSVTHVKYVAEDGTLTTITASDYAVIAPAGPRAGFGTIAPAYNVDWPSFRAQRDAVQIRFVAGYGGPEKVPNPIKSAIKLIVGDLYENREAQIADARAIIQTNKTTDALLLNFQAWVSGLRAA